ncbi:MAG: DUF3093 domain-containing protein [Candidatus Planktophila sp.]|nr:DUF3093 domain-containing protein [Candidatus Planktophila sp.]
MHYREVVRMPVWLLALIYFFLLSLVLSIWAALGDRAGLISLIFTSALLLLIALKSAMVIEIDSEELRVGKAHIPFEFLGSAVDLSIEDMRKLRTRDADPAAYLGIRFWTPTGVKVLINDVRDSTPYWVISSKNGDELAKVLNTVTN